MAVKEAKATVARARGSRNDEAKAKRKAKVEDAEALTTRIRTRTRTSPGEAPFLRQGGPVLSPLEGSKTRGLRPVPKRKRNKNKELSVATKMGTSLPNKRSRFMRMAPKLRKKGFDVTCPAEF